jgi:hypothetical protein
VTRISVAIAGIFGKCDSITQQDASHKNKISYLHHIFQRPSAKNTEDLPIKIVYKYLRRYSGNEFR